MWYEVVSCLTHDKGGLYLHRAWPIVLGALKHSIIEKTDTNHPDYPITTAYLTYQNQIDCTTSLYNPVFCMAWLDHWIKQVYYCVIQQCAWCNLFCVSIKQIYKLLKIICLRHHIDKLVFMKLELLELVAIQRQINKTSYETLSST